MEAYSPELLWLVIIGFLIAFVLAFGIGANDVANSFGTSVGSGVLTIRQACVLATVCEISGAVLIGYKVSDTMRKGILEVGLYDGSEEELMLGCVAALASSAIWLLVATFLKLPISGTHSIVGSTIGFSLVARGTNGLKWSTLATIVGSWFISPVLSGCVSICLFLAIRKFILRASDPLKAGFRSLPIFYGVTFFINVISVVLDGPKLLYMDNIPTWLALTISVVLGLLVALLTQLVIVPIQKRRIAKQLRAKDPVKFNFEDSVESSPSGSPKKNRRPVSLVSDGKQLPAIAEITELVSLTDNSPKPYKLAPSYGLTKTNVNENYKINPEIIRKAEDLLGNTSLDNTDLTITSLKFIDEQHQNGSVQGQQRPGLGHMNGITGNAKAYTTTTTADGTTTTTMLLTNGQANALQDCFRHAEEHGQQKTTTALSDSNKSVKHSTELPKLHDEQHNCVTTSTNLDKSTTATAATTTTSTISANSANNNNNTALLTALDAVGAPKKELNVVESASSLEMMISSTLSPNSSKVPLIESKETISDFKSSSAPRDGEETEEVSMLFAFLQVLTATFGSFAHGGNDVSNAIGPLIALYMIYREGSVMQKAESPIYILIYGGIGISVGLWLWGRRVIETIGNDLTKITSSTGFTIEVGAAITVLLASKIGLPISTTHCKVGSVVFVGHVSATAGKKRRASAAKSAREAAAVLGCAQADSVDTPIDAETQVTSTTPDERGSDVVAGADGEGDGSVDWHLFRNIAYAWIVTVPVTALLSAIVMFALCAVVLP